MTDSSPLNDFFGAIKSAGLFKRIFCWKKILGKLIGAETEYFLLKTEREKISDLEYKNQALSENNLTQKIELEKLIGQKNTDTEKIKSLESRNLTLTEDLICSRELLAGENERAKNLSEKYTYASAELEKITIEYNKINEKLLTLSGERKLENDRYLELRKEHENTVRELSETKEQAAAEESIREERTKNYERNVENLNVLVEQLEKDRRAIAEKLKADFEEHQKELEASWKTHESDVSETIRNICKKYDFVWCDKSEYPNKGVPDNVVMIGGLYTVFDAKSPKNPEELDNFPQYLKSQAEAMSKYCKFENVRKDAFLVVPSSTLDILTSYCYDLAEYTVYVITPESVLPIMQILKLIENYEFAEQLSPEDKDKLCRFIGKLSHTTKRKIQIDTYFAKELISALREIDSLPEEFANEVEGYEQKAKLNPPMEKRAKTISVSDIESDVRRVENEIVGWSVVND
ncbi:MAG: hypothetical protein Q4Q53_01695 [Methanocorpusculum sp.]|nr:hypothetical protein [Methanocorpusculum sp.]